MLRERPGRRTFPSLKERYRQPTMRPPSGRRAARSADFPITQGALQTTNNAASSKGQNAFVALIDPTASLSGDAPSIRPNLGVVDSASYRPTLTAGGIATVLD